MQDVRRVTVFVGSPQKRGATHRAADMFKSHLEARGGVEVEIVHLADYEIGVCRGCKICFNRGEESCPFADDRDLLISRMEDADGVVFASPNYFFQVSAVMKIFLDRIAFFGHRPRFHGKAFTAIVVQGIGAGGRIVKYLNFAAGSMGFTTVKGSCTRTLAPMTAEALERMESALDRQSARFHKQLMREPRPVPSLLGLIMFRMARTGIAMGGEACDRAYYRDNGWFESDYYYPTHLGLPKRLVGRFFDWVTPHLPVFKVADGASTADSAAL